MVKPQAAVVRRRTSIERTLAISLLVLVSLGVGVAVLWSSGAFEPAQPDADPHSSAAVASSTEALTHVAYVGSDACAACHADATNAWRGSQHAVAMQAATASTVRGDFADAKFRQGSVESTFFKRDGRFFVHTDGPNGALGDYAIAYTFGVDPLQQYLVAFPDGRLQALSIAWDTRPATSGGQRWFTLYPGVTIAHTDPLHWTGRMQNWNFMCAECHVTGFEKNYDATHDRFDSKWAELGVGCEACHGPGAAHVAWANAHNKGTATPVANKGLVARLDERAGVVWQREPQRDTAARSAPRTDEREIEVCAQCHARRAPIAPGYVAGMRFLDYYRPELLTAAAFHSDGQQRAEVYNWATFLQSKMYEAGVTCSDCHEPHAAKLRAEGNALCTRCHSAAKFDATSHHHHPSASPGAQCVNCHMPAATYMQVDPRRDHGLRPPRPDLTLRTGAPNACNGCHVDRDAKWAAIKAKEWWGEIVDGHHRYAEAFAAGDAPAASARLREIASQKDQPAIARASAVARLDPNRGPNNLQAIAAATRDGSPLVRLGALQALAQAPSQAQVQYAMPLLSDTYRAVRIEAANMLAGQLDDATPSQRRAFDAASAEFAASQRYNGDRPDARASLGAFDVRRGNVAEGIEVLKSAIALDPLFTRGYIDLADAYRDVGDEALVQKTLRTGIAKLPRDATLHHALGLALIRAGEQDAALAELALAAKLDPRDARFAYVYAVALNSRGEARAALSTLEAAAAAHPGDRDILGALSSIYRDAGDAADAAKYAERLQALGTE